MIFNRLIISNKMGFEIAKILWRKYVLFFAFWKQKPIISNHIANVFCKKLFDFLKVHSIENYFVFDMSIPDTIMYLKEGMNVFIRQSEHELGKSFYESASGIWLDAFERVWYSEELVKKHLNNGKKVAIVSSELHNREYLKHWTFLKSWNIINNDNLILCTDLPEKAIKFFKNE